MQLSQHIKALFQKYLDNTINNEELLQLYNYFENDAHSEELDYLIQSHFGDDENNSSAIALRADIVKAKAWKTIQHQLNPGRRKRIKPALWWAAAASIITVGGIYFLLMQTPEIKPTVAEGASSLHDIEAPSISRAMITLANGQKIYLDSAVSGVLSAQNNVRIVKTEDGRLVYESEINTSDNERSKEPSFNTLSNPRGSMILNMVLNDGTKVWLNAGSSITYPVEFFGNERKVNMTGEAYFEVASLKVPKGESKIPFIVENESMKVTVLGTHFDVFAYDDESEIRVTLLQGSVKVKSKSNEYIIKPGQQANIGKDNLIHIKDNVDLEQVMAWKGGLFIFDNTDLISIMKQISRWYDVEVEYTGKPSSAKFGGGLSKNLPLSDVQKLLEVYGFSSRLEGKKLTITNPGKK